MPSDGQDKLDQILDSALATYSGREPWPGIERRILARLPQANQSYVWLRWAVPVPVLAGVLMTIAYCVRPEPSHMSVQHHIVQNTISEPEVQPRRAEVATVAGRKAKPRRSSARFGMFPAPSPLSAEERALVQLAGSNPEVLRNALVSYEHHTKPLTLEPINIPLLENGGSTEH